MLAKEPHVVDVANFLNSMGANIRGAGTDVIKIRGVRSLHKTEYSIIPDQIEAGTFMFAAAATQGDVTVLNVIPKHLDATISKLIDIGCEVEEFDDAVRVVAKGRLRSTQVKDTSISRLSYRYAASDWCCSGACQRHKYNNGEYFREPLQISWRAGTHGSSG